VQTDLIVGADGLNSKVRPHNHPNVSSEYTGGRFTTGLLKKKTCVLSNTRYRVFSLGLWGSLRLGLQMRVDVVRFFA
jgi:2-polyprenyl-6-methoxyphenol hydroxylase-like FAD-dependent oxidoreductase